MEEVRGVSGMLRISVAGERGIRMMFLFSAFFSSASMHPDAGLSPDQYVQWQGHAFTLLLERPYRALGGSTG
jgi:hypothetical protein